MSRSHLIPTPVTTVAGVQTTVYRRADANSGGVSASLSKPQQKSAFKSTLKAEAYKAVFGDDAADEAVAAAIENSSAPQLKNIKEAMGIVRERAEMDGHAPRREIEAMQAMVADGAHSVIAKAVEHYDEAPESETLAQFAKDTYTRDILDIMYPHKDAGEMDPRYMQSMTRRESAKELENIMRAVKTTRDMGAKGPGVMAAFNQNIRVAETFGKHLDIIPEGMMPHQVEDLMKELDEWGFISIKNDKFDTFGAHLKAAHQFEALAINEGGTVVVRNQYVDCEGLLDAVEMYPDHVDEVMAYRKDRQTDDFDNDLFRDYLGGGALREGML
jgi:hypothetical protein